MTAHCARKLSVKYPKKRAYITGAGGGLGLAFATRLAEEGWTMAITDVNSTALEHATEALRKCGGDPVTYNFDVSNAADFHQSVSDFANKHSGIDIGINNAGIGCGGLLEDVSVDVFRRVIEINLMGVVHGCHSLVPIMRRQHSGHILNIASAAAFVAAPQMSAYSASKAAVLSLSETLRGELHDEGVLVSVLMPTYVRTNIGRDSLGASEACKKARHLVDDSPILPDQVVVETLKKMADEALYIVMPDDARFLWRFKRLFPDRFWRFILGEVKHRVGLDHHA